MEQDQVLKQGSIVQLSPQGRGKDRLAIVVNNKDYYQVTSNYLVCTINTSKGRFFLQDKLPDDLEVSGNVELASIEVVDPSKYSISLIDTLKGEYLERILVCLRSFF